MFTSWRSMGRKMTGWVEGGQQGRGTDISTGQDTNLCPDLAVPVQAQPRVSIGSQSLLPIPHLGVRSASRSSQARGGGFLGKRLPYLCCSPPHPSPRPRGHFLKAGGGQ